MEKKDQILLVKKAKKGDADAFVELCERYEVVLYNAAFKMLLNNDDVADCLQETEIRAWKNICKLTNEAAFNTWIFRIMINLCKDKLKKRVYEVQFEENMNVAVDSQSTIESDVDHILGQLSENYRIPLILYYYMGFNIKEISEQLKISKNAVKIRMSRGRLQIKNILEGKHNE